MVKYKMPWPAIEFKEIRKNPLAAKTSPGGIPSVAVLDRSGKAIAQGQYNAIEALKKALAK